MNEQVALNIQSTIDVINENNVVTLQADMTNKHLVAEQYLKWAGNESTAIPFIAIIPAGRADQPITFDGPVTPQQIIKALEKAGPSVVY